MKNHLPENAKIAKDSKETVQECVSEFISFITSEASDKCMQEKRKTINGDDLLWAMSTLGFDKYVEPLKLYLAKYREAVRGDKPEKGGGSGSGGGGSGGTTGRPPATAASAGDGVGVPPPSKKSKKK
jgi:nuclear transcription Y subunit beta